MTIGTNTSKSMTSKPNGHQLQQKQDCNESSPSSPSSPQPPQVFLGGSCNPTTWRQEIAIPFLEDARISYFNPQVSDWRPELLFAENQAKKVSDLMLL